jgi:hypothetical protein
MLIRKCHDALALAEKPRQVASMVKTILALEAADANIARVLLEAQKAGDASQDEQRRQQDMRAAVRDALDASAGDPNVDLSKLPEEDQA